MGDRLSFLAIHIKSQSLPCKEYTKLSCCPRGKVTDRGNFVEVEQFLVAIAANQSATRFAGDICHRHLDDVFLCKSDTP